MMDDEMRYNSSSSSIEEDEEEKAMSIAALTQPYRICIYPWNRI